MVQRPILLLPGYYGSRFKLKKTDEVIWVDLDDVFSPKRVMEALRLGQDPDPVYVSGLLDAIDLRPFWCVGIYKKLKRFLKKTVGYSADLIHDHPIDWRQSLDFSADRLHAALQSDPLQHQPVDLLCHSHGGLVARAYLTKYGNSRVARCITLGTPHHGMLKVLQALYEGIDLATFNKKTTKPVARTMPSAYELLPRFAQHGLFSWNGLHADPLTSQEWTDHEPDSSQSCLLRTMLKQASKTTADLLPNKIQVPSFFIYGTRLDTQTGTSGSAIEPMTIQRGEDGDSTVATISAMGGGIEGEVVRCPAPFALHMSLFNDAYVRKLLKSILRSNILPYGEVQVCVQWQNRFYFPNTEHGLAVEVRDDKGDPLPGTLVQVKLYRGGHYHQPLAEFVLPQTSRGDFFRKIPLPGLGEPLRYQVKITHPDLPDKLRIHNGSLHPR